MNQTSQVPAATGQSAPLPRRAYVIFGLTALMILMVAIDGFIVAVGFPTIKREFGTDLALVGWIFTGFQLANIIVLPMAGKLSDEFGRKRLFLISVGLFTLASVGCGAAQNIYQLIFCRVLQGVAGGAVFPSAIGIVSDAFGARRQTALGLFSSIYPIGAVIGPNIGGYLIEHFSWRWIFFVNLPIGVALLVLGVFILPAGARAQQKQKIDFFGGATYGAALFLVLFALAELSKNVSVYRTAPFWGYLAGAAALFAVFVRHERRTPAPMIDLQLLAARPFLATNLYGFVYGAAVFGVLSFFPLHAQLNYGMSPTASGFVLTPRALVMSATSTLAAFMLARTGYRRPMIFGVLIVSFATMLLSFSFHNAVLFGLYVPDLVLLCIILSVSGIGNGIVLPSMNNAGLDLAPGKIAAISGLRGVFNSTGGLVGAAMIILAMSQFPTEGEGLRFMFGAMSVFLLCTIPLVFMFPDAKRRGKEEREKVAAGPAKGSGR